MAGVVHQAPSVEARRSRGAAEAPVRATALTALSLVALALGLTLLMLPGSHVAPEVPPALFVVALAILAVTLLWSRGEASVSPITDVPASLDPRPEANRAASVLAPKTIPGDSERRPSIVPGRGSAWRVLSSPSDPGDETWLSWLPRETRRLGGDGPPIPSGVLTSPGRAGNLVAFPVRDYYGGALPPGLRGSPPPVLAKTPGLRFVGDEHLPPLSPARATPFSEEELDRMFPPEGGRGSRFLTAPPDRVGTRRPWSTPGGFVESTAPTISERSDPLGTAGGRPVSGEATLPTDGWGDAVYEVSVPDPPAHPASPPVERKAATPTELSLEAANPTPPHLRPIGAFLRCEPQGPARPGKGRSVPRSVCASCSRVVVDLHLSGPCPRCLRPLCNDCLREALVSQGHGWCLDCSPSAVAG